MSEVPQVVVNVPSHAPAGKDGVADILNGIAAILWPLLIGLILILFRSQIASLARRLRKGSAFGAEAEFDNELEALNREARKAAEETQAPVVPPDQPAGDEQSLPGDDVRSSVLAETSRSPRLGLMLLSAEIDKLARKLAASAGYRERSSVRDQLQIWGAQLPSHVTSAFRLFSQVRNRIVHGAAASEQEILSAIDSGLLLYQALDAIPIEQNVVIHTGVDIFGDEAATQMLEGKAVILETTHQGNRSRRIFPSTLTHFKPGMKLTWEWNLDRIWGPAWYRDPDTGEILSAWGGSGEFVGRDLDEV